MTIEWHKPSEKLPENGQECLLVPSWYNEAGLITIPVHGPIAWSQEQNSWFDLFAMPEGGIIIPADKVGLWTDWRTIAPEELKTPKESEG